MQNFATYFRKKNLLVNTVNEWKTVGIKCHSSGRKKNSKNIPVTIHLLTCRKSQRVNHGLSGEAPREERDTEGDSRSQNPHKIVGRVEKRKFFSLRLKKRKESFNRREREFLVCFSAVSVDRIRSFPTCHRLTNKSGRQIQYYIENSFLFVSSRLLFNIDTFFLPTISRLNNDSRTIIEA